MCENGREKKKKRGREQESVKRQTEKEQERREREIQKVQKFNPLTILSRGKVFHPRMMEY